jgi:hypothetical protein
MKTAKAAFIAYIQSTGTESQSYSDFKRRVSGEVHFKWILRVPEQLWGNVGAVLQWFCFDERLLCDTITDISDEIEAYVEYERRLRTYHYDDSAYPVAQLSQIICDWLKDFSLGETGIKPKFGPGSVAEMKGRLPYLEKARNMVPDPKVVRLFCELTDLSEDEVTIAPAGVDPVYRNRIIFRPKNALKHRIISAEPTWLTWLQQAVKGAMFDYVEHHPKMFTWFSDQARSREMALKGSVDGSYATFDFSNASDSVTVELVASLFRKTYIRDALLATRSTHAELPDGQVLQLCKFAPMGSATCFATMDVIILSICELAIRKAFGRPGQAGDYTVYGDDAIIRVEAASHFLAIAESLHFIVNRDKSYWDPTTPNYYRESCGIEAYNGVDITPLRYSRFQEPLIGQGVDLSSDAFLSSVVALMNNAYAVHGFANLRSVAQECIKHTCDAAATRDQRKRQRAIWDRLLRIDLSDSRVGTYCPVRFEEDRSAYDGPLALIVPDGTATNYRAERRYNRNLQRAEIKVPCYKVKPLMQDARYAYEDQGLALHAWHFRASDGRPDSGTQQRSVLAGVAGARSQKWDWVWFGK